jgi:hypothetical protein
MLHNAKWLFCGGGKAGDFRAYQGINDLWFCLMHYQTSELLLFYSGYFTEIAGLYVAGPARTGSAASDARAPYREPHPPGAR